MSEEKTPSSGTFLTASLMYFCSGKPTHFYSGVDMGPFADPGFVYEDDGSALPGAVFFSAGQRFFFQCRMASSSRWTARPVGRWQEKFSPLSSRQTPDSEYCSPLIFSISRPTRAS